MWVGQSTTKSGRLIDYLPKTSHGSVFTTHDKRMAVRLVGQILARVSEMDKVSGKQLVEEHLVDQDLSSKEDAMALPARLTYLPLAFVQAVAYINSN